MPEKNLIHVWKETLSSKSSARHTFKGMHLGVLHQATQQKLNEQLEDFFEAVDKFDEKLIVG